MGTETIYIKRYTAPCGKLLLGAFGGQLCLCDWIVERHHDAIVRRLCRTFGAAVTEGWCEVLATAATQLDDYFAGRRQEFSVPLRFGGTEFQQRVWQELLNIPYGTTISYAELARRIGRPTAMRAVAAANGANAISVFAPCHRVIGSDGSLTGYGGGVKTKRFLLEMEANFRPSPDRLGLQDEVQP